MPQEKDKYSLWIVPTGRAGKTVQALVDKLANENKAPRFVPHLTLVANIFADATELKDLAKSIEQYTERLESFTVTLTSYGYTEEEFRSLYLLAVGDTLQSVYKDLTAQFPQISQEHFRAMPHMSVLYGDYSQEVKDKIITANPLPQIEFTVDSFDLYLTNSPVESWKLAHPFPLA